MKLLPENKVEHNANEPSVIEYGLVSFSTLVCKV